MSHEGKLKQHFHHTHSHDEIGQLSLSFASLFEQLEHYTEYLETMVRKLSHELGTPLSIIKSSLENMQIQGISNNNSVFLRRAIDGSQRLGRILSRMSEASRLEQALQSSQKEVIEINQFIEQYIEGIQQANPDIHMALKLPEKSIIGHICPELIAQLLDKLISNAISFHAPGSHIHIILAENHPQSSFQPSLNYHIEIFNFGQLIPDNIKDKLFESMISFRPARQSKTKIKSTKEVNLGLGLHIAKLISNYHDGKLFFINRKKDNIHYTDNGVSFIVELKTLKLKSNPVKSPVKSNNSNDQ